MIQEKWLQKEIENKASGMPVARLLYSASVYLHIPVVMSKQMLVSKQT